MFIHNIPEATLYSAVYNEGRIVLPTRVLAVDKILFDTGALQSSYISKTFVNKYRHLLYEFISEEDIQVVMADSQSTQNITEKIVLDLEFVDGQQAIHNKKITLHIFEMSNNNFIIGLPDILEHFSVLFKDMLNSALWNTGLSKTMFLQ